MIVLVAAAAILLIVIVYDLVQKQHAILRNFPIIGHFRYMLETFGPELRQYIVTSNDEERPFSRDQRRWVYASAKRQNNYFGFGTDNDLETSSNYLILKHAAFPVPDVQEGEPGYDALHPIPAAKVLGGARGRRKAFRPASVANVSGMSFGSLSARAVEAINRGCRLASCLHNTGEGSISPYHLNGGELIWQIGTAYFGCRDARGHFSMELFSEAVEAHPVRAIEIKLSQGAKPGRGGVLPSAKITPEIAEIRKIPLGADCVSPAGHTAFRDVDSMLDFVELLADRSGLPVGIKSAVGEEGFWRELAEQISSSGRSVDFITVDGGEGGTGAAPLVFSDHVALPFKLGFSCVYKIFAERDLHERILFIGSGKLGFPETAQLAFALGCDMIAVGREAMMAVGCIQAQRCHTGNCPTGVATQSRRLMRGLDPAWKSVRMANYICTLRKELLWLAHAVGKHHPSLVTTDDFAILDDRLEQRSATDVFGYRAGWGLPSPEDRRSVTDLMTT